MCSSLSFLASWAAPVLYKCPEAVWLNGGADAHVALEMVEEELPVVPDLGLAHNAQILLDACHGAGLLDWSIALALALENTLLLSGALQHKPKGCGC